MLVDKPDIVESIKEEDINDDDHHNVETVGRGDGEVNEINDDEELFTED